ncbi:hypothetical protein HUW51_19435 [Adhaeribacter swui]|uniref:Carboxypeptidase-like regulatory domain-containing protein n=1 Tax=Adhaeribacter swui TaxID=2086471 RepID=A0A7G7GCA9_9BACT|nr:carboxypeptidase-like regulatory domain-containing protein [Adhaeribacter swui]QNF34793.1 hypothetical protein HUW51_19435 [Adhaeribacter swui]
MAKPNRLFLLISALWFVFAFAQNTSAQNNLARRVSVNVQQQRLADALDELSRQGNFYFSYNSNIIPEDSLVTVVAQNQSIRDVLDEILPGYFEYKEAPRYVILRPAPYQLLLKTDKIQEKKHGYIISGHVVDAQTGAQISGASIYEKRLLLSTLSDADGFFKIKAKTQDHSLALTVTKELYQEITVNILSSVTITPGNNNAFGYDPEESRQVERTGFGRFLISSRQRIQSLNLSGFFANSPFQASLTPGLSSHGMLSSQVVNKFSLNVLGGYTAGVNGVEWAGAFNINKKNAQFMQAAGLFNMVGGNMRGVQFAGLSNTVLHDVNGVQAAGLFNRSKGTHTGVQAAGLINTASKTVNGAQIAGISNYSKSQLQGIQVAGLLNIVNQDIKGWQIAGLGNISRKNLQGTQIGGLANISHGEIHGIQIAGLYNYAKKLRGLQVGIVNKADSSAGISLGILNFIKGGYRKVSLSANELTNTNISLKTGNATLYSIISAGVHVAPATSKRYNLEFGLGHDFLLSKRFALSTELTSVNMYFRNQDKFYDFIRTKAKLQVNCGKKISVFAGPTFSLFTNSNKLTPAEFSQNLPPKNYPTISFSSDVKGWLGWETGISLF